MKELPTNMTYKLYMLAIENPLNGEGRYKIGPFSFKQIQEGLNSKTYKQTDLVWKKEWKEWKKISECSEFMPVRKVNDPEFLKTPEQGIRGASLRPVDFKETNKKSVPDFADPLGHEVMKEKQMIKKSNFEKKKDLHLKSVPAYKNEKSKKEINPQLLYTNVKSIYSNKTWKLLGVVAAIFCLLGVGASYFGFINSGVGSDPSLSRASNRGLVSQSLTKSIGKKSSESRGKASASLRKRRVTKEELMPIRGSNSQSRLNLVEQAEKTHSKLSLKNKNDFKQNGIKSSGQKNFAVSIQKNAKGPSYLSPQILESRYLKLTTDATEGWPIQLSLMNSDVNKRVRFPEGGMYRAYKIKKNGSVVIDLDQFVKDFKDKPYLNLIFESEDLKVEYNLKELGLLDGVATKNKKALL